jgi:PAS domain S-box-containing protein
MINMWNLSIKAKIWILFSVFGILSLVAFFIFFEKVVANFVDDLKEREVATIAHALSPVLSAAVELEMDDQIKETMNYVCKSSQNIVYVKVQTHHKMYQVGAQKGKVEKRLFPINRANGEKIGELRIDYTLDEGKILYERYLFFALGYLLALFVVGGIVFMVVGHILDPLRSYAQKVSEWKLGDVIKSEEKNLSSELVVIDQALVDATNLIAKQYQKLLSYQEELEYAVNERTLELSLLNEELEKSIKQEVSLRLENEKFNNIMFDTTSLGLTLRDENFCIIKSNQAYRKLFGDFSSSMGKIDTIAPFRQSVDEIIKEALRTLDDHHWSGEYQVLSDQGETLECFIVVNQIEFYGAIHYIVAVTDLTEIKLLEEEKSYQEKLLLQHSKLASMGEMMGNIAHQWRQPLTQISSLMISLELASDMGALSSNIVKQKVSMAESIVKYMSQTIDDFRNFFLPNKAKKFFKPSDTIANVCSIMKSTFEAHGIALEIIIECEKEIEGFDNEYGQVIMNVLSNAKDNFIEKEVVDPLLLIKVTCEGERVCVAISDNGGGIDSLILDKIFEPYFTTKHKSMGTGLGLYMSKMIIEKNMGGSLDVSNISHGVLFEIKV